MTHVLMTDKKPLGAAAAVNSKNRVEPSLVIQEPKNAASLYYRLSNAM